MSWYVPLLPSPLTSQELQSFIFQIRHLQDTTRPDQKGTPGKDQKGTPGKEAGLEKLQDPRLSLCKGKTNLSLLEMKIPWLVTAAKVSLA